MNIRSKIKVIKKGEVGRPNKSGASEIPEPEVRRAEVAETVMGWIKEFRDRTRSDCMARRRFHLMFATDESR